MKPLTADELGINPLTLTGLEQIEREIRRGLLVHVPMTHLTLESTRPRDGQIPKGKLGINMLSYMILLKCGIIHCIWGWLSARDQLKLDFRGEGYGPFYNLCHPAWNDRNGNPLFGNTNQWNSITADEVASAIFNYRHFKDAKWQEIIDRRPR
jgi:hypothetical protein